MRTSSQVSSSALPVLAVASGKGGVGKSSVAVGLAKALHARGLAVGLVDADLYGPDVPRMLGLRRDKPATSIRIAGFGERGAPLDPVEVDGVQVVSAGFLLGGTQGLAVGSGVAEMLLARLLNETRWGAPDVIVVDLPPGTADLGQALMSLVRRLMVVLVVTPAEVAHLDTGRLVTVLRRAEVRILGGVQNMAYLDCPDCARRVALHPRTPDERTIWAMGVARLAELPYRVDSGLSAEDLRGLAAAVHAQLPAVL